MLPGSILSFKNESLGMRLSTAAVRKAVGTLSPELSTVRQDISHGGLHTHIHIKVQSLAELDISEPTYLPEGCYVKARTQEHGMEHRTEVQRQLQCNVEQPQFKFVCQTGQSVSVSDCTCISHQLIWQLQRKGSEIGPTMLSCLFQIKHSVNSVFPKRCTGYIRK